MHHVRFTPMILENRKRKNTTLWDMRPNLVFALSGVDIKIGPWPMIPKSSGFVGHRWIDNGPDESGPFISRRYRRNPLDADDAFRNLEFKRHDVVWIIAN